MPKNKTSARDGSAEKRPTDARFSNFETDPRFRLPSKKHTKTTIDKRFSRVLKDDDFVATAKVDRYGRKLRTDTKKKALQRLYQEEEDEDNDQDIDADELVQRELRAADEKYDPARGGGFSSSEDESEDDEQDEEEDGLAEASTGPGTLRDQQDGVETGEVTRRIAIVNLDWDNIKSVDLFALFSSFVPLGGSIQKVSIYPSEFGKSRMQREELEGPPKEIFRKKADNDDDFEGFDSEDSEEESADEEDGDEDIDSDEEAKNDLIQEGDDRDFDSDALRSYQLDRLRYYYAVLVCSDPSTAHKIYEATDGSEYLSSSNFLDLRFVPDDVTFDDEPRDECNSVPSGYKPVDFVTDALQHSKVKLTWDMHPEEASRKESIKKAFSGSRAEIAENDLRAYLASDSDGDDDDADDAEAKEDAPEEAPLSKKELARRKMRAALGLADEPVSKSAKSAPVGDMQITFTSALTAKDSKNKDGEVEETTLEKYKRKEKERKAKKKEQALAKREGKEGHELADESVEVEEPQEDLGFDDPFFTSEDPSKVVNKSTIRKEERRKKREAKEAEAAKNAAEKAQLELLMAGNTNEDVEHLDHFDMNEIIREEKRKNKKNKKAKKEKETRGGLQEDFKMDVDDSRFKAVFESHEFAIDPSNPKFKATGAMKKLLEEGRKKRKAGDIEDGDAQPANGKKSKPKHSGELSGLVEAVKKKSGGR